MREIDLEHHDDAQVAKITPRCDHAARGNEAVAVTFRR